MRQVTITALCDGCDSDGRATVVNGDGSDTVRLSLNGGALAELDLCPQCFNAHVAVLASLIDSHGRAPDPVEEPKPRPPSLTARWTCPTCGDDLALASAAPHIYRRHLDMAPPVITVCPECEWKPPRGTPAHMRPRQVGKHRKEQHGRSRLDDALDALAG